MARSANRRPESQGYVVYALVDPRDGRIRYVGKTGNLKRRLSVTWSARAREDVGGSKAKRAWLLELAAANLRPSARVLESSSDFDAIGKAEEHWIAKGHAEGWGLTNCHVKTSGTVPLAVRRHFDRAAGELTPPREPGPRPSLSREAAR